jgi:hypothetical protein
MEQLTFNDIIEKITDKLRESDDDAISYFYNTLFDNPIQSVGNDTWEEILNEDDREDIIDDDYDVKDIEDYDDE